MLGIVSSCLAKATARASFRVYFWRQRYEHLSRLYFDDNYSREYELLRNHVENLMVPYFKCVIHNYLVLGTWVGCMAISSGSKVVSIALPLTLLVIELYVGCEALGARR